MNFFNEENITKILYGIIIILLVAILTIIIFKGNNNNNENNQKEQTAVLITENEETKTNQSESTTKKVHVDIKGAVKKPGVYELESTSIINDVIKLAGGLKNNASTEYLNLSKQVSNEMVIKIYTRNEIKKMNIKEEPQETCNTTDKNISDCAGANIIENGTPKTESTNIEEDQTKVEETSKISINHASKEELMTLTGIGESKANSIIEYREKNNGFSKLEDLLNVSGIGESAYNKIKEYITL